MDTILEGDKQRPAKQRHTAKRIFERLKEEHGFTGGYTIVEDYVRSAELHSREMFIPLPHAACEAQADLGEKRWWWSPAWSGRRTTWLWTCLTRTTASMRHFRPRPSKLS
jgi:hypothetical protein